MKDLNDKAMRQQLTERYLNADTTTEEEAALANFYRQSHEVLSAEEEIVRQLVLASTQFNSEFTLSDEKVEEFDRIMASHPTKKRRIVLWPWLAAACVAAILAIILAPPRSGGDSHATSPTAQIHRQKQEQKKAFPKTDTSEVMPKTFLANRSSSQVFHSSTEEELEQNDLFSVDSVFGVESRPDPLAEYTALNEKLKQECDAAFEIIENQR